jgi:magnesium and cobalt transporter
MHTRQMDSSSGKPSLLERLSAILSREPEDRDDLLARLRSACDRNLINADALSIMEGALQMSDMQVSEVMIPRAQMDVIHLDDPIETIVSFVVDTAHSRFPAVGDNKDDVVGIFLAKDLLRYYAGREFDLRDMLRPAIFVPESKRLNVLLREFRVSRNHMAIVVDEYGGVAGLVTIEDVLEQIVGDIEDEFDFDEAGDSIRLDQNGRYRVKATTEIEDFNHAFATDFSDEDVDTVGGLVIRHLGRLPKRGEVITLDGLKIQVMRADSRRVHTLLVERANVVPEPSGG